jgi:hypothetical protein
MNLCSINGEPEQGQKYALKRLQAETAAELDALREIVALVEQEGVVAK